MEEGKAKSKNNGVLVCLILVLLFLVLGLGAYILLSKENSNNSQHVTENNTNTSNDEKVQNVIETKKEEKETRENLVISFDGSKSINSSEKNYTLSCQGNAGIFLTVDKAQKKLTFSFTPTRVIEIYALNWTSSKNDMKISEIAFDKKIVDVFFGGMGQSVSGDTVFILLEDGTVEYIPIVHMFNHAHEEVISYGKINSVSDIQKFTLANTSNGFTTLAIKSDGTFYDLWYALKDTGYYK